MSLYFPFSGAVAGDFMVAVSAPITGVIIAQPPFGGADSVVVDSAVAALVASVVAVLAAAAHRVVSDIPGSRKCKENRIDE